MLLNAASVGMSVSKHRYKMSPGQNGLRTVYGKTHKKCVCIAREIGPVWCVNIVNILWIHFVLRKKKKREKTAAGPQIVQFSPFLFVSCANFWLTWWKKAHQPNQLLMKSNRTFFTASFSAKLSKTSRILQLFISMEFGRHKVNMVHLRHWIVLLSSYLCQIFCCCWKEAY